MTDLSGYAKKSTANGATRSGLRLRLRIAVPGPAAEADPPQHLTCGKWAADEPPSSEDLHTYPGIDAPATIQPATTPSERDSRMRKWLRSIRASRQPLMQLVEYPGW